MAVNQNDEFRKRGIKASAEASRPVTYVGQFGRVSFQALAVQMLRKFTSTNTDVAALGEVYKTGYYQKTSGSTQKTYEPVFDRRDWSKAAEDPNTLRILEEVYGNYGVASEGETAEQRDLLGTVGLHLSTPNTKPQRELSTTLRVLQLTQVPPADVDTTGIRGIEELTAPIDPYA